MQKWRPIKRGLLLGAVLSITTIALTACGSVYGYESDISSVNETSWHLWRGAWLAAGVVGIFTAVLILWPVFRHRRKDGDPRDRRLHRLPDRRRDGRDGDRRPRDDLEPERPGAGAPPADRGRTALARLPAGARPPRRDRAPRARARVGPGPPARLLPDARRRRRRRARLLRLLAREPRRRGQQLRADRGSGLGGQTNSGGETTPSGGAHPPVPIFSDCAAPATQASPARTPGDTIAEAPARANHRLCWRRLIFRFLGLSAPARGAALRRGRGARLRPSDATGA